MAKVWVKAKSIIRVDENGHTKTYHPGDWCMMGKQQAREELSLNTIEILKPAVLQSVQDLTDCAILFKGTLTEQEQGLLLATFPGIPIQMYTGGVPNYGRFLIWDTTARLKRQLILTGFQLLRKWQLAVPLYDYNKLAEKTGTAQQRERTEAIIHDLRVPVYDDRVIFGRRCREVEELFRLWNDGSQLGFLTALYRARPVVNALPPSWVLR